MTHEELCHQLETIRPNAVWNLSGNTYEGLTWLDQIQPKPTAQELGL